MSILLVISSRTPLKILLKYLFGDSYKYIFHFKFVNYFSRSFKRHFFQNSTSIFQGFGEYFRKNLDRKNSSLHSGRHLSLHSSRILFQIRLELFVIYNKIKILLKILIYFSLLPKTHFKILLWIPHNSMCFSNLKPLIVS